MIFLIRVHGEGSLIPVGHVEAESREAALRKLELAEMPRGTMLSELTAVTNFDQMVSTVIDRLGPNMYNKYYKELFEKARKKP